MIVPSVRVTKGNLGTADILIGMNIINLGDFAVTNKNGATKFTFRVPSQTDIDFVLEAKSQGLVPKTRRKGKNRTKKPKTYGKNKNRKR